MNPDQLATAHTKASQLLEKFVDPGLAGRRAELIIALRPRDADYARVFTADGALAAKQGYAKLWNQTPHWPIRVDQTAIKVFVTLSDQFAADHPRAGNFPGGYRGIARFLQPGLVWTAWEFLAPNARDGLFFDGLVDLDDRWAWFPKPWRVVPTGGRSPGEGGAGTPT